MPISRPSRNAKKLDNARACPAVTAKNHPLDSTKSLNNYVQAAQEAVSTFDIWIKTSQVGVQDISKKAMSFAQRNVLSAFEFYQKIVQAKDVDELIQMQTEFVRSQIQVLNEQVKDLGESATEAADIATKAVRRAAL